MDLQERLQLGPHLTLVERKYLLMLANISQPHVVPAFSSAYELCDEFDDLPWTKDVRTWVDNNLLLSVSVKARGRTDIVETLARMQNQEVHEDFGRPSPSMSEERPAKEEKKDRRKLIGLQ